MGLTQETIQEQVTAKFGAEVATWDATTDILTLVVPKEQNLKVIQYLKDDCGFNFLTDICAVHYPDNAGAELTVVYHLHNLVDNIMLRLKVNTAIATPDVYTATSIFAGANWMERETYDFFGVNFVGHPNLKRVLNVDEMDYFPLRKEYPLEDQTRIDKDDEMFGRGGSYN